MTETNSAKKLLIKSTSASSTVRSKQQLGRNKNKLEGPIYVSNQTGPDIYYLIGKIETELISVIRRLDMLEEKVDKYEKQKQNEVLQRIEQIEKDVNPIRKTKSALKIFSWIWNKIPKG